MYNTMKSLLISQNQLIKVKIDHICQNKPIKVKIDLIVGISSLMLMQSISIKNIFYALE